VISQSESQEEKQKSPRISTVAGTKIDFKDEHPENADLPSQESFDDGLNVTAKSEEQFLKDASSRKPTSAGISIYCSVKHSKKAE
jgi:hypothetical protein